MRRVSSGKAARSAGSPDRSPAPSAHGYMKRARGKSVAGRRRRKKERSSDGESWGSQISFFRAANIHKYIYIYLFFQ